MFNKRRQSRDAAVIADALAHVAPEKIGVSAYSATLFPEGAVTVYDDPLAEADICFAECGDFLSAIHKVQRLIVYRWNRLYPGDAYFPLEDYLIRMTLVESSDFSGNSHERITREVYEL